MNITDLFEEHGVEFRRAGEHHHVTRKYIGIECPFCSPNLGKFRLGLRIVGKPYATCWQCGPIRLGDLFSALGIPVQQLHGLDDVPESKAIKHQGSLKLPQGLGPLAIQHQLYLENRGFDPGELERLWGLRGIGVSGRLSWRIWIPVQQRGETVSWTTRSIGEAAKLRYISAPSTDESTSIKDTLYGLDYVRHAVIVTEGPTDVWKIGPGAVCTFGMNVSLQQLRQLAEVPYRLICFDNEPGAKRRALDLAERLVYYSGETKVAHLESGEDVAAADEHEVKQLREFLGR